jgi:flagellar biogenesis protein FliO
VLLLVVGQVRMAIAEDAPPQLQAPATSARQAIERATHIEPARLSLADSEAPRPLPPAKRDSLSEKSDSPRALGAIVSVAGSLAVVLGLFFLLTWLIRRGMPSSTARLPDDVVSVLGKAPLLGRQQLHVLRFGNKLLLVCASASGFEKLAEITEPEEFQRIVGLCDRPESGTPTTTAGRIFGRLVAGGSPGKSGRANPRLRSQSESARAGEAADA